MSGICGIVFHDKGKQLNPIHLVSMVRALDVSGQGEDCAIRLGAVGLGAQKFVGRLAGVAEVTVHERPVALAIHGSLYNLRELFHSQGQDVNSLVGLLRLYLKEGMAFLHRLRGEFALALWDGTVEVLHLAVDRFRIHPLLYYQDHEKLVFASRMSSLQACHYPLGLSVNPEAIVHMVASSAIPTPATIFREVKKLPPGHRLTYRQGEIKVEPYWDISFLTPDDSGEKELARKLKSHFTEAVAIRLNGDGGSDQLGTFLSGGIDSSTVTSVLMQLVKRPIQSFSIGFEEPRYNEITYARIAAQTFGAEHHEYFVSPKDTYDVIPILLEGFDEPYGNASAVPTYFCAKLAREHGVDILYAGDGGDELFAGNASYAGLRLFEYYRRIPRWLQDPFLKPLVFTLADGLKWDLLVKGKKYIQRASLPAYELRSSYGFFKVVMLPELLEAGLLEMVGRDFDPYAPASLYYFQAPARSELDHQLYIDLKLAISDNDLFKVTRMTEVAGVTVRFPFLDHRLAEFAASIPAHIKMRGRKLRSFFKKAYANVLPVETRHKKKHGFGLPIPFWLRTYGPLNEMMCDLVLSSRSMHRGYFRRRALEELVACHKADHIPDIMFYGTALWNLMILELWLRRHESPRKDSNAR